MLLQQYISIYVHAVIVSRMHNINCIYAYTASLLQFLAVISGGVAAQLLSTSPWLFLLPLVQF